MYAVVLNPPRRRRRRRRRARNDWPGDPVGHRKAAKKGWRRRRRKTGRRKAYRRKSRPWTKRRRKLAARKAAVTRLRKKLRHKVSRWKGRRRKAASRGYRKPTKFRQVGFRKPKFRQIGFRKTKKSKKRKSRAKKRSGPDPFNVLPAAYGGKSRAKRFNRGRRFRYRPRRRNYSHWIPAYKNPYWVPSYASNPGGMLGALKTPFTLGAWKQAAMPIAGGAGAFILADMFGDKIPMIGEKWGKVVASGLSTVAMGFGSSMTLRRTGVTNGLITGGVISTGVLGVTALLDTVGLTGMGDFATVVGAKTARALQGLGDFATVVGAKTARALSGLSGLGTYATVEAARNARALNGMGDYASTFMEQPYLPDYEQSVGLNPFTQQLDAYANAVNNELAIAP